MEETFAQNMVLKESSEEPGSKNNKTSKIDISQQDKPECEMETNESAVQDNVLSKGNTVPQEQSKKPKDTFEEGLQTFKANNGTDKPSHSKVPHSYSSLVIWNSKRKLSTGSNGYYETMDSSNVLRTMSNAGPIIDGRFMEKLDNPSNTSLTTETSNKKEFIFCPSDFPDIGTSRSFTSKKYHRQRNYNSSQTNSSSSTNSVESTDDENLVNFNGNKSSHQNMKRFKNYKEKEPLPVITDSPVKNAITSDKKTLPSKIPQPTKKFRDLIEVRDKQANTSILKTVDKISQKTQQTQTEAKMNKSSGCNAEPSASHYVTLDASKSTMSRISLEKIALINSFIQSADGSIADLESIMSLNNVEEEEEGICQSNSLQSITSGTLKAEASTSGIYSESTKSIEEESLLGARSSNISLDSSNFTGSNKLPSKKSANAIVQNLKTILAAQAFKNLEEFKVHLPQEISKLPNKFEPNVQSTTTTEAYKIPRLRAEYKHFVQPGFENFRRKNSYSTSGTSNNGLDRHWTINGRYGFAPMNTENSLIPQPIHTVVVIIEHLEKILQLLLTVGLKMSQNTRDYFDTAEVPTAIHNAMSDVKTFLEPLKTTIKVSIQGEYLRPFVESIHDALMPIYNHLNDSVIALESPAAKNHLWLKLDKLAPKVDIVEEIAHSDQMNNLSRNGSNSNFLMEIMNAYNTPPGFNSFTLRPGCNRASVHPSGLIVLQFLYDTQVILTVDLGIIAVNKANKKVIAISADGLLAGIKSQYGECMQRETTIDMTIMNPFQDVEKRARISPKGVMFQDERSSTTYLVTNTNISTCPGIFSGVPVDFVEQVFYSGSRYGTEVVTDCINMLRFARNEYTEDGTLVWLINNVLIKQHPDGQVIIHRNNAQYTVILSPNIVKEFSSREERVHTGRLSTPGMHVTCSVDPNGRGNKYHFYVRQEEKKIYASELKFVVRNGNQTAGLNKDHKISLRP